MTPEEQRETLREVCRILAAELNAQHERACLAGRRRRRAAQTQRRVTFVTVPEAARAAGVSPKVMRRLVRLGIVPAERAGRVFLIRRCELVAFLRERELVTVPEEHRARAG